MDRLRRIYLETIGVDEYVLSARQAHPPAPPPVSRPGNGTREGGPAVARGEELSGLARDMGDCRRCPLGTARTRLVFGVGSPEAELVFVGEAPGEEEDLTGEPFVGKAGQLLTRIIEAMGLSRRQVYICNVLKCRPPGNRSPQPEEIAVCKPFLLRQIKIISPRAICALGTFSAQTLLQTDHRISLLRGRFHDFGGIPLMPTYHPSYLLRNPEKKKEVWADVRKVMELLGLPTPGR